MEEPFLHISPDNFSCGTGICRMIDDAFKNYHNGLTVQNYVIVDEVEMKVLNDWEETGHRWDKEGREIKIIAPLTSVDWEDPLRLMFPSDIEGFTPLQGHEYRVRVRRFYWYDDPYMYRYELLSILDDKTV